MVSSNQTHHFQEHADDLIPLVLVVALSYLICSPITEMVPLLRRLKTPSAYEARLAIFPSLARSAFLGAKKSNLEFPKS
jgi:hypothetical protein